MNTLRVTLHISVDGTQVCALIGPSMAEGTCVFVPIGATSFDALESPEYWSKVQNAATQALNQLQTSLPDTRLVIVSHNTPYSRM